MEHSADDKSARQGQPWSAREEQQLYQAFNAGAPIDDIALTHQRRRGGILAHLRKLGLLDHKGQTIYPAPEFSPSPAAGKRAEKTQKSARRRAFTSVAEKTAVVDINACFAEAARLMEAGKSLFITGKAGTGKSTLLRHFKRHSTKNLVVLAPTGIAALNVQGQTIHHFFHFSIDVTTQKILAKRQIRNPKIYKKLEILVIDEVSMVRADILDCVDTFLRMHGPQPGTVFGGVQLILIGDLYQLPPVVNANDREIFSQHYATPYFFSAHALRDMPLQMIELEKVYRQKDPHFVALLNRVRDNTATAGDVQRLNQRHQAVTLNKNDFSVFLTTTNRSADRINGEHLAALPGKTYRSAAAIDGDFGRDYFPAAAELQFKKNAQIMLLTNDREGRWVNGSIGAIKSVQRDQEGREFVTVQLADKADEVQVYPYKWEIFHFALHKEEIASESVGSFEQYPFRLAWAMTIHKSQGKTFDRVTIDASDGVFASGQIYVALSRCTSFEGITLQTPLQRRHIRTDTRVVHYLSALTVKTPTTALIEQAISTNEALKIVYIKSDGERTERFVYPKKLGLKKNKGTEFLGMEAFCTLSQQELLFSIDRIVDIKAG